MTTFRNIQTKADVAPYLARLNDGYEERTKIVAHIIKQIEQLGLDAPVVAELCVGPGFIATSLCEAFPTMHYVGLDFMQPFLDFTAEQLPVDTKCAFVLADLTEDAWPTLLAEQVTDGRLNVIVSMQSLHDVGGAERIADIYSHCHDLLADGGLFINADFVASDDENAHSKSTRLRIEQHRELLGAAGFTEVDCSLRVGSFCVCQGTRDGRHHAASTI
ncbi:MAG: class I SAM-dependent methyltransferase [Chloroflexota bacterium]